MPGWHAPPCVLSLAGDEVHVWRAALALGPAELRLLEATLSADEVARAAGFRFERDRRRFVAAHGALRDILARYLDNQPARLEFARGPSGKPALAPDCGSQSLRFSLSHSHELALCAVAWGREVGVDVERIRMGLDELLVARRFFSPPEVAVLEALSAGERSNAFYTGWTRKEAYIKARGEGLGIRLDSFTVSLGPGEPAALVGVAGWSLAGLEPAPGYVGAVAAAGQGWKLQLLDWQPRRD